MLKEEKEEEGEEMKESVPDTDGDDDDDDKNIELQKTIETSIKGEGETKEEAKDMTCLHKARSYINLRSGGTSQIVYECGFCLFGRNPNFPSSVPRLNWQQMVLHYNMWHKQEEELKEEFKNHQAGDCVGLGHPLRAIKGAKIKFDPVFNEIKFRCARCHTFSDAGIPYRSTVAMIEHYELKHKPEL
jgi:hypothetical protein